MYWCMKKKTISRTSINRILDAFEAGMKEEGEDEELDMGMMKMMFGDLYFATEIATARKIKSFSNEEYERKGDNSIIWKFYPFKGESVQKDMSVVVKTK